MPKYELVPHPSMNPLLDAVDALSQDRVIHTWLPTYRDRPGYVHTEVHPPLLILLRDGVGLGRASASSEIRIPIDADALEMEAAIRDQLVEWCRWLKVLFDTDLTVTIRRCYIKFENARRAQLISYGLERDILRTVESWVRMIEQKFDPDEVREWTDPCPAWISEDIGKRRCAARRIVVDGKERFAVKVNVTRLVAECAECGTKWEGMRGLGELRVETNRAAAERRVAETLHHDAE